MLNRPLVSLSRCGSTFHEMLTESQPPALVAETFLGHASITETYDRYGHLLEGSADEAAQLLNAYLERAAAQARIAAIG